MLVMVRLSQASDDTTEATWPRHDVDVESCWRRCCRGDLAATWYRCQVMLITVLLSQAGDSIAEATWPWRDVYVSHAGDGAAESCWQRHYRGDLATLRCKY
jgi:hypothetical protein